MTQYQVQVINGRHWVFATETGIDRRVIGVGFDKPKDAIKYADALAATPYVSPLRANPGTGTPIVPTLPATPCDLWPGPVDRGGYGKALGRSVHRTTYEEAHGQLPAGMEVGHICHDIAAKAGLCAGGPTCRHRRCRNLEHLRAQTHRENTLASPLTPAARNARTTHCSNGHPLAEGNLVLAAQRRGRRQCRICRNAYLRARRAATT